MKKVLLLLATLLACASLTAQEQASWLLNVRSNSEYMCEKESALSFAPKAVGDSFMWIIEASDAEPVYIKNKATGKYLSLTIDGDIILSSSKSGDALSQWMYGGFDFSTKDNAGWYTIKNVALQDGRMLCLSKGKLVYAKTNAVNDYSAHWTFQRVDSDQIPYTIDKNSVKESSFLGERQAVAVSSTKIESNYHGAAEWNLTKDISSFPKFTAKDNTLIPALYNMALEESLLDIRPSDNTFCAGALWPDTWTRDVVYSIWFAYSWILPEISRKTLEKQTLKNPSEALQDTGSGGSYPISTDRVVWAVAAWEYYLATGDVNWLKQTYAGLGYTAKKDLHVAYDAKVHLFKGETCSMDWRTHTYPNWFTNAIIGESFSSGTNALHYFLYTFLSEAGKIIKAPKEEIELWEQTRADLKEAINRYFYSEEQGLYKVWLYPEFMNYYASERVGAMSSGLAAIFGVADKEQKEAILNNFPHYAFGAAVLYPSKPEGYSYHNKSIWPVWQTPLMYIAKKDGNYEVLEHLVKTTTRSGALFLSHKENMTYDTGYDRNTALNSPRQLWSVASYLSIVYRVFFGMEMSINGLSFAPYVPEWVSSEISLQNFNYRKAKLNINVRGNGNIIKSLKVNGKKQNPDTYILPCKAKGSYKVEIELGGSKDNSGKINMVKAGPGECWSPVEPVIRLENEHIFWTMQPGVSYTLVGPNGNVEDVHSPCKISKLPNGYYSIFAIDQNTLASDLSNPVLKAAYTQSIAINQEDFNAKHEDLSVEFELKEDGDYMLWFTGTNGHGPHEVFCTIRSLFLDGEDVATVFLEAYGDWNEVTKTNHVSLNGLKKGKHVLSIKFNPEDKGYDNNMSYNTSNLNDWHINTLEIAKF